MRRTWFVLSLVALTAACGGSSETADPALDDTGAIADDAAEPDDTREPDRTEDTGSEEDSTVGEDTGPGVTDSGAVKDAAPPPPPPPPTSALLRPSNPMPCADPAIVSEKGADKVFYIYCTSMSHVWKTSDWVSFTDERKSTTFNLDGMTANGKSMGSWWAPGTVYSKALDKYVMWVSVPDGGATNVPGDGWSARALAVLIAPSPTGPWDYKALAVDAGAGEHFIDPFLFIDTDGNRYVYWKQYGGGVSSSIMGARVDATWTNIVAGTRMEVMNGYGGPGTWEDNVRENPTVHRDSSGRYHMLFSGGHWNDDSYATAHALSTCGPLCSGTGGWHMVNSGDRGILQAVKSKGNAKFKNGGPGGAVWADDSFNRIVYAAAAKSASGDKTRYLMLDKVKWQNGAPYVDTAGHEPFGY